MRLVGNLSTAIALISDEHEILVMVGDRKVDEVLNFMPFANLDRLGVKRIINSQYKGRQHKRIREEFLDKYEKWLSNETI